MVHSVSPIQKTQYNQFAVDDFLARRQTSASELPDPQVLLENLARCVFESLAGARDLDQISRWITDKVYYSLRHRVGLAERARRLRGQVAVRPLIRVGKVFLCQPAENVVEAAVLIMGGHRVRSVAVRLEGLDGRWRATAISVL